MSMVRDLYEILDKKKYFQNVGEHVFFHTNNNLLILVFSREKKKSCSCLVSNENQIKPELLVSLSIYLSLFTTKDKKTPKPPLYKHPPKTPQINTPPTLLNPSSVLEAWSSKAAWSTKNKAYLEDFVSYFRIGCKN
jgi:hypothetical protein